MLDNTTYQKMLSDARTAATARLGDAPTYNAASENETLRKNLYDQITNRQKFRYNINEDGLYQTYKDKYVNQGRMAMRDTMGQAAALTGGYGNSYGQAVGQQAYDRALQSLNDVVPQLYGQAFSIYQEEGNQLQNQYGMANSLVGEDWDRYRASMSDWLTNKEMAETQAQADAKAAWDMQQKNYTNLYTLIGASGYNPSDSELAAAGMSREAANAVRTEYLRQTGQLPVQETSSGGGGSSSGVAYWHNGRPVYASNRSSSSSSSSTSSSSSSSSKKDLGAYWTYRTNGR